mmetsp:Transcript_33339/g.50408  ORF Transcript_33339/g.50408 Transcript_33339/m.50408 type:complete len:123 (-) Transcript_33339:274-642(-)
MVERPHFCSWCLGWILQGRHPGRSFDAFRCQSKPHLIELPGAPRDFFKLEAVLEASGFFSNSVMWCIEYFVYAYLGIFQESQSTSSCCAGPTNAKSLLHLEPKEEGAAVEAAAEFDASWPPP